MQGRSDHKKATPICYSYLDHYKLTSSKLMKTKVLQQVPGPSNLYRVISEAEANLFKRVGVAKQGALTHFLTWEVNKYNMYGPDDSMAEGMPIFAPLQSWGVQLEKPSSAAFELGKFAFWSDALEERNSNWISSSTGRRPLSCRRAPSETMC